MGVIMFPSWALEIETVLSSVKEKFGPRESWKDSPYYSLNNGIVTFGTADTSCGRFAEIEFYLKISSVPYDTISDGQNIKFRPEGKSCCRPISDYKSLRKFLRNSQNGLKEGYLC